MDSNRKTTAQQRKPLLSRRNLLKTLGAGVAGGAVLYGADKLRLLPGTDTPLPEPPQDRMTCRTHPRSGDRVSLLGFGGMRLPMLADADSRTGPDVDEAAAFELVDYALAHGVNYFDTAWPYHGGVSETVLGKALRRHPRESFFLADKMPTWLAPTREQAKELFERQLKKCQVAYFDYYLLHSIQSVSLYRQVYEQNGVLDYLLAEKAAGRIRHLGWSFHGDQETLDYVLSRDVEWDFALVQLNYHDLMSVEPDEKPFGGRQKPATSGRPAPARWMYDRMQASGLPLIVMEPLLGGRLARLNGKSLAVLQAEHPQASAASWAFRYVAGLPNVLTVLSGMTYREQLEDNIRTFAPLEPLSKRERDILRQSLALFLTQDNIRCNLCGYCMPCPYGVDIPAVFGHYNRCLDDGHIPKGTRDKDYEAARRAYLVEYERSVPELRQAARCTGCRKCVNHCPQMLDIPAELARLTRVVEQLRTEV